MFEDTERFRLEAREKGLSSGFLPKKGFPYYYDLNSGQVYGCSEPEKIFKLVSLAKKNSTGRFGGIHCALLNLVARREEVNKGKDVYWSRLYHVDSEDTKKWISLRELLEDNDYDLSLFSE